MTVKKIMCPEEKYPLKSPYPMRPTRIVIHDSGSDASAAGEAMHMLESGDEASFHFAADESGVVQCLPCCRSAWHAGDGGCGRGNREGIAVVICRSHSGGDNYRNAVRSAARLCSDLMHEYGISYDRLSKHQDFSGKFCPHRLIEEYGFDAFRRLVAAQDISDVQEALDRLSLLGITDSASYWRTRYKRVKYLDLLLIRSARAIIARGCACGDVVEALDRLCRAGVVNTRKYWERHMRRDRFLPLLIKKLGGSV